MRLNSKLLASVFATAALGAAMAASTALAHPPSGFTCSGTMEAAQPIPGGVYSSVSMPAGSICYLTSPVTIMSPLKLGDGAGLAVVNGSLTVRGPVTIGSGAAFGDLGNSAPIDISGPVTVGSNGALIVGVESLGLQSPGPIVSAIAGPVSAHDASTVQLYNTQISGPVKLDGGGGQNAIINRFAGTGRTFSGPGNNYTDLEADHILGPVSETGYDGIWAGVIRDIINGPLTFRENAAPPQPEGSLFINSYDIGSNRIFGPATCEDNEPAPNMLGEYSGSPSIVYGPLRGNQAATCTGTPAGTTGPPV